jgi:hypothetical protein
MPGPVRFDRPACQSLSDRGVVRSASGASSVGTAAPWDWGGEAAMVNGDRATTVALEFQRVGTGLAVEVTSRRGVGGPLRRVDAREPEGDLRAVLRLLPTLLAAPPLGDARPSR